MKLKHTAITILCFLLAFSGSGCAQDSSLQKKYGADSSYFIALTLLRNNETNHAIRHLKTVAKKGSPLISKKAMEKLAETGTVSERLSACHNLYKAYSTEESLLLYIKELFKQKEFYSIIDKTDNLDLTESSNELIYYRLLSMLKKNDSRLKKETDIWLREQVYSSWHKKLYLELKKTNPGYTDSLAEFRYFAYNKDYPSAASKINSVLEVKTNRKPFILSETGKSLLYGTKDFYSAAAFMDSLSNSVPDDSKFYCSFYAGRLYEKAGNKNAANQKFISAMQNAKTDTLHDNSLWYIFDCSLSSSAEETYNTLVQYIDQIIDKEYFNDFFDTLSVRLISTQKWELYKKVADLILNKASEETCAKFSYITGRLIESGYIKNVKAIEAGKYFNLALNSGTDLYYKILSMERLSFNENEIAKELCSIGNRKRIEVDKAKENLLYGYADFGLAEFIYDEYQNSKENISTECAKKIARFLWQCGNTDESFLVQSIRIASQRVFNSEHNPDKELLTLAFPQNFSMEVSEAAEKFSQDEWILYALIRSESFFNSKVSSHAGALGLTQLMDSTAKDVARKLKFTEYDLTDAETNILFGSFYFEELTRRLDDSIILAAFSYNGGISRVRSWIKSASIQFGAKKVPNDLFLEALPYSETREYGRKILSAAAMYGWLYYDLNPVKVAEEILK